MKIGDIIMNEHAGDKNPYKYSIFIGRAGRVIRCLCRDGHISAYHPTRNEDFLKVVGHVDLFASMTAQVFRLNQTISEGGGE